ncbi:Mini-ribonuclease 3 [Youngiibacter multivorans]|uniref:Mini-ribonuclease 3 n=1 Tax=Youngiibacter multivorans TaxID=937251 RepID=A0ABS4G3P2_9CLOT|nr:ribonuclease III domain-containing protein [Youngiibacter multivorans]MBP1919156.1 ribonuclease-3 family protein [Youngiibacter multivorans]
MEKKDAINLNPLILAFIGDSTFENFVRERIILRGTASLPHKLHLEAIRYVKAANQSYIMEVIESGLSEEEAYIFKRGRNMKSMTVPKNAKVIDYRRATGFEALIGYLFLIGEEERLLEIMELSAKAIEERKEDMKEDMKGVNGNG